MASRRVLTTCLVVLAAGVTTAVVLGPLLTGRLAYRTSETTLHQIVGGDLAALVLVVPVTLVAAVLVARGHRAGPVMALAPGTWAVYMYAQLVLGQEYLDLPGNNEQFFPLLLGIFITGAAVVVLGWRAVSSTALPRGSRRLDRIAGTTLLLLGLFLVGGLHLPGLVDALGPAPSALEYTSSPTAFWVVKLMDLGIVVPAAVAIGIGLLRDSDAARRAGYALLGGYTLLGACVAGMAVAMYVTGDPDGSLANVIAFGGFAGAIGIVTVRYHLPLFERSGPVGSDTQPPPASSTPVVSASSRGATR